MQKIASFTIDHTRLQPGIYVLRIDGDITTYDLRAVRPNTAPLLTNSEMHSFEHMFTTFIRNGAISQHIIYFGPMGCQTGFYLLVREADHEQVVAEVRATLQKVIDHETEVFGASKEECGNYKNLDLEAAKKVAYQYKTAITTLTEY